ncbi:VOC family protein [Agromyces sp. NBRC 114283]|uniref:VOC family protein n=1 Tax=Agromyces sp. NBRC 114283 TaxID=2994521 RepID=UPI0024A60743|nr:VOC family protein [Agromyces sp. NBRC 114283]GLU90944.1 hypothetical protein Agsp01_31990 [Agromyces sp. NBRC 114283]
MPVFDHLGVSVADLRRGIDQFDAVLTALGFEKGGEHDDSAAWWKEGETEFIVFAAREPESGPHEHGRVGWQHLAFAVDSRDEVDRLHAVATDAGWNVVRAPKLYPRFNERYYASFLEDDNGIRIEFMHNPPRDAE